MDSHIQKFLSRSRLVTCKEKVENAVACASAVAQIELCFVLVAVSGGERLWAIKTRFALYNLDLDLNLLSLLSI